MSSSYEPIIFVLPTFDGGGAERVTIKVASALHQAGHAVVIVGLLENTAAAADATAPQRVGLACARVSDAIFPLLRLIRSIKARTVVSTLKHVTIMVAVVHMLTGYGFRHVIRVANTYSRELARFSGLRRFIWTKALAFCHRPAHRNICVSAGVRSDLISRFGIREGRCFLIANPVDLARLDELSNAHNSLLERFDRRNKLILSVGRLTSQKDFAFLIEAFNVLVNSDAPACELLIVGEGPEREKLEALVDALNLRGKVHLMGWQENPYPFYKAADVFALSSRFEGMPNVILEALAFGLPVVSTDCESGPREILVERYLGQLVSIGESLAMTQALRVALEENKESRRREYIAQRFAPGAIARMYEHAIVDE